MDSNLQAEIHEALATWDDQNDIDLKSMEDFSLGYVSGQVQKK